MGAVAYVFAYGEGGSLNPDVNNHLDHDARQYRQPVDEWPDAELAEIIEFPKPALPELLRQAA